MATKFFTNAQGNTLIREFEGILAANPLIKNLDAVVGFLRASGYFALRPFLDGVDRVRGLIGIDVDKYIAHAANRGKLFFGAADEVRADFLAQFKKDLENAPYRREVESGMRQMVEDIVSGKLELRAHPSKKIHAKMYILYPEDFNQYTMAAAITGSSNLSGNGLGIGDDRQYEFNVKLQDYEDVNFAKEEFEKLWDEAEGCPIAAPDVQTTIDLTYLGADATPYEIYIKTLIEYFGDRVEASVNDDPLEMPDGYVKFDYQLDAGYQLKQLPIPKVDEISQLSIVVIVDRILAAKKENPDADTSALESEIDQLVYKLYGLTPEEIAVVESSVGGKS